MVHQYKLNGFNIVLDTCSGGVHVVDEVAYDMIALYPQKKKEDIISELLEKYNDYEDVTAEELNLAIGGAYPREETQKMEVRGRDLVSGLPKNIAITDVDMVNAMGECLNSIVDAIKYTLEKTPPELASDIMNRGIYLTGGGALIFGLDKLINEQTGMPVKIADNPVDCVVLGAGKTVESLDVLRPVLISRRV